MDQDRGAESGGGIAGEAEQLCAAEVDTST
jgi:hypothetical protein